MYEKLGEVALKSGERVEAGLVQGPDLEWAGRVEALLAHKGGIWNWQNARAARCELGIEVCFYLLHREGEPLANMMTATFGGAGHFGHVWTRPEDRRQGAARQLMGLQMEDFRRRGGRALFLGTGFDSPPYRIYAAHGFRGVEAGSGNMEYYAGTKDAFEAEYFARGEGEIQHLDWRHWPASAALFLGAFPGVVRCAPLGLFGRMSTEGVFLRAIQNEERRREDGEKGRVRALVLQASGAVAGLALWDWDPLWPQTCLFDIYCHPAFWDRGDELLESVEWPRAERYLAYADARGAQKGEMLERAGFRRTGQHARRVAADRLRRELVDVEVWEK